MSSGGAALTGSSNNTITTVTGANAIKGEDHLTFDGSDSSVVSAANDTITSLTHRFVQGQRVTYNNGGGSNFSVLTS